MKREYRTSEPGEAVKSINITVGLDESEDVEIRANGILIAYFDPDGQLVLSEVAKVHQEETGLTFGKNNIIKTS